MIVGYFSVLELGISASVTKYVAQYMALKEHSRLNNIIKIDFSSLDDSSETADTINHYFKILYITFLPFRNDFYMKVFN